MGKEVVIDASQCLFLFAKHVFHETSKLNLTCDIIGIPKLWKIEMQINTKESIYSSIGVKNASDLR